MARSGMATGHSQNIRESLRPGSPGVQVLTTTVEKLLAPPITGDTRFVHPGSRVYNRSDEGPCEFQLYYVPLGGVASEANQFAGCEVDPKDYVQLGGVPMVPGFEIWGSASLNGYLNILIFFDEVE